MIKVSELLSKRLISLNSAQNIGTVSNIIFNSRLSTGKLLKIYNDDDDDAEIKYVELKKVKNLEFDAGVIADDAFVTSEWNTDLEGITNPINSECFNQDGKSLGFVRDIVLDNSNVVSIIICKENSAPKEFAPTQILSYSSRLMIFNDTNKPIKLTKTKPSIPKKVDKSTVVKIHADIKPDAKPDDGAINTKSEKPQASRLSIMNLLPQDVALPLKVPPSGTVISTPAPEGDSKTAYKFLLGKVLAKDIKSSGKVIIKENTVITNDIINIAKNEGKLVQLALHAE